MKKMIIGNATEGGARAFLYILVENNFAIYSHSLEIFTLFDLVISTGRIYPK